MKTKTLQILIIDDHPSMIEGYKSILSYNELDLDFEVTPAYDCKSAYEIIESTEDLYHFDLVFLDLSLPPYEEKNILSGEDLAVIIKKKFPFTKLVMITSHAEAFVLYDIQKKIAPNGLLVKSDFTADEFLFAISEILDDKTYASRTVKDSIADMLSTTSSVILDELNRDIITLLSQGVLTKNLPDRLQLSQSAIDKRKAQIRQYFFIKGGNDEDIVREAKKHGFI